MVRLAAGFEAAVEAGGVVGAGAGVLVGLAGAAGEQLTGTHVSSQAVNDSNRFAEHPASTPA